MDTNHINTQEFILTRKSNDLIAEFRINKTPTSLNIKKYSIIIILLLVIIGKSNAGISGNFSVDGEISRADLIIKGKLIDKFSRSENIPRTMRNGNREVIAKIPSSIFTTYIFKVEEVLKGKYEKDNIKILMLGGCDYELDLCVDYSFNYYYEVGEQAVLILTKTTNDAYKADQGSYSAFSIKNNNILLRKSSGEEEEDENEYPNKLTFSKNKKITIKRNLTLENLKTKILDWENKNEK
ncbi:hypothetical protein MNBD_GAMMA03-1833 [hydrothermal vent metagenome]|uniref:Uncharacterized protein n=1 Tax=hydrothermal vent metagenome TaxID=652676 RepID=A0A3B0WSE5_9ZZZZ